MSQQSTPGPGDPLMNPRTAIILALGVLVAIAAALLTLAGGSPIAGAVLAGGGAFGGAVLFFHKIIG